MPDHDGVPVSFRATSVDRAAAVMQDGSLVTTVQAKKHGLFKGRKHVERAQLVPNTHSIAHRAANGRGLLGLRSCSPLL